MTDRTRSPVPYVTKKVTSVIPNVRAGSRRTYKLLIPTKRAYERDDFEGEEKFFTSDADFMRMPSDEVMYGSPHHIIDSLPGMVRCMLEEQTFINFSNRVFRMIDPVNAATDPDVPNGAGIDEDDVDEREGGRLPALLMFIRDLMPSHQCDEAQLIILEKGMTKDVVVPQGEDHMIMALAGDTELTITSDKESKRIWLKPNDANMVEGLKLIAFKARSDEDTVIVIGKATMDLESNDMLDHAMRQGYQDVYQMHDPYLEALNQDDERTPEWGEDEVFTTAAQKILSVEGIMPDLTQLDADIRKETGWQFLQWKTETSGRIPQNEWRVRRKARRLLDMLALGLDSPYVGAGYKPPQPRWQKILQETPPYSAFCAERRRDYAEALHAEAKNIRSMRELYGEDRQGGFYGKIRGKNAEDKEIALAWSERPRRVKHVHPDGSVTWETLPSMFHVKREAYIERLKAMGMTERDIRRKLWHWFDRRGGRKDTVYRHQMRCPRCGRAFTKNAPMSAILELQCPQCKRGRCKCLHSQIAMNSKGEPLTGKTTDDSVWRQRRSEAFQELHCTYPQWTTIYQQCEIQKRRIRMGERITQDRTIAINAVRALFLDCETHSELRQFRFEIYKQEVATSDDKETNENEKPLNRFKAGDILKPSLIDRVSFGDEDRIMFAFRKRWKEIADANR